MLPNVLGMALEKPSTMNELGSVMDVKTYSSADWPATLDAALSNTPESPGPTTRFSPVEWQAEQPLSRKTFWPLTGSPAGPSGAAGASVGSTAAVASVGSGADVAVGAAPPAADA